MRHGLLLACASLAGWPPAPALARPNVVVILADDLGFSDLGCFGGEIRTPNVDRLAAAGLRLTQFYNCGRCCPTRAALLTGQYPHKVGLALNGRSLTRNGLTIAEALKAAGYNTAMAGKWHLSRTQPLADRARHQKWLDHQFDPKVPFAPPDTYPVRRGFDRFYGIIWGVADYFDPFSLVEGAEPVRSVPKGYYLTDAITKKAVEYVREFSRSEKPFFLYAAYTAPHWPLHARPEDLARYKDAYRGGWRALRQARYERQLKMGLFGRKNAPLPELTSAGKAWDDLSKDEQAFQAAKMAAHAALVDRLDQGVGELVAALKAAGRLDDTVIFFLSDNGASPEVPAGPGYDRSSQTRDGRPVRYAGFAAPGPETTYTGIGPRWASAANTPFRYWKAESFEGGCHTPLVVAWPKGLKAKAGSVSEEVGHVIDLLPTCLELAGAAYPKAHAGHRLTAPDGKSLLPTLLGRPREGHSRLFFEHQGGRAVREGDWKLVAPARSPDAWELYDLAGDRTETRDLAREQPDRVRALRRAWADWFKGVTAAKE
jgi:arylsulfatase